MLEGSTGSSLSSIATASATEERRYNCVMEITLNGQTHALALPCTVAELLDEVGLAERRVAVEVNRQIVPRSQHGAHRLAAGDRVEIVHAIGGG